MPLAQITLVEGRPPAVVRDLIAEVTDAIVRTTGSPRAAVRVLVHEIPAHCWGVGGLPKSDAPAPPEDSTASEEER